MQQITIASANSLGVVQVPASDADGTTPLSVDINGNLTHNAGVTPGSFAKVSVNKYGLVSSGGSLMAGDIPDLSYDQITSGLVQPGSLADNAVRANNLADFSTVLIQEGNPGPGAFVGQLWYQPSTAQLRIYGAGSGSDLWMNVGFGNLQAQNLRWGGTYNADNSSLVTLTSAGAAAGLKAGDAFLQ